MIMVIGPHKRKPDVKSERTPRPEPRNAAAADQPVPAPRTARPPPSQAVAAANAAEQADAQTGT